VGALLQTRDDFEQDQLIERIDNVRNSLATNMDHIYGTNSVDTLFLQVFANAALPSYMEQAVPFFTNIESYMARSFDHN
jgi:hypothetical protein